MSKIEDRKLILAGLILLAALLFVSVTRADHNPHYEYPKEPVPECRVGDFMVNGTTGVTMSCQNEVWTVMLTLEEAETRTRRAAEFTLLLGLGVGGIFGFLYARSK